MEMGLELFESFELQMHNFAPGLNAIIHAFVGLTFKLVVSFYKNIPQHFECSEKYA